MMFNYVELVQQKGVRGGQVVHPERIIIRIKGISPILFLFAAWSPSIMFCRKQDVLNMNNRNTVCTNGTCFWVAWVCPVMSRSL